MATISGTSGSDTLNGTSGNDTLSGLGGNDMLVASGGTDFFDGGAGTDTLDVRGTVAGVVVNFADGTVSGGFNGTFANIERVLGSNGADSIIGAAGNQNLSARGGNDTLAGGAGNDTLWSGGGADTYVFRETGTANADFIADFSSGSDKILLDAAVMSALGANGIFGAGDARFAANSSGTAQDASDRVIFNTSTNQLFYDADGDGAGAAVLIATLQSGATLMATDIVVEGGAGGGQVIEGTAGNDSLAGGAGNDSISGLGGNDTLSGLDGDDIIDGGAGIDSMIGGAGADVYLVDNPGDVIDESELGGLDVVFASVSYTLPAWVDNLTLTGNSVLDGTGNDIANVLVGNINSNLLTGGLGADTLTGGAGGDRFFFTTSPGESNADRITDFSSGADRIILDGNVMPNIGGNGLFAANDARFSANSTGNAQDASDRVIFNTATQQVFYDPDGNGSAPAALVATLQSGAALVATDIAVVNGASDATEGNDNLVGTDAADTINGLGGDDTISGLAGNDLIDGGDGRDNLFGDEGNDTLLGGNNTSFEGQQIDGGAGADSMVGGLGHDIFFVDSPGDIVVAGGGGQDQVYARVSFVAPQGVEFVTLLGAGFINATGNELSNGLMGGTGANRLAGLGGNDTLWGDWGDDTLDGGAGNDTLTGYEGADVFVFADTPGIANADSIADFVSGTDTIQLDAGMMQALGTSGAFASGDERFHVGTAAAEADDRVIYNSANGQLFYDADGSGAGAAELIATLSGAAALAATDIVVINGAPPPSNGTINGTGGNDTLSGTDGNDTINGLDGNDLFLAGSTGGNDVINGGAGRDSIEFKERATSVITVDFVAGTITGGSSGTISFTNIERILTGNFNDTLTGNAAAQTLTGQGGSDTIWGAGGADTLWGGAGADTFVFREMGTANADRISDFATGLDKLHLDDAAFAAIGAMGDFAAADGRFVANSSGTATDTNDRVVFNTSTGQLYYDADGSGSGAAALIATVQTGATVAATDIVVI